MCSILRLWDECPHLHRWRPPRLPYLEWKTLRVDIPLHSTDGGSPILFCPVMGITLYSLALAAQLHAKDLHTSSACHAQPVEAFYSSIFEVKGTCSLLDHVPQI